MAPEAEPSEPPWAFKPAIWEVETARKHTQRRCDWKRDQAHPGEGKVTPWAAITEQRGTLRP